MARKKKGADRGLLQRLAGGGANARGRGRRSNRPRGEGAGLIDSVRALFRRG
jgi:hypothetical protein